MPVTVLYPEARQQPDELEREVFGPDVRIVKRDTAALSELSDADCAEADGLMIMGFPVTGADLARFPQAARDRAHGGRLRQARPAGGGGAQHPDLQRARLRHHRGRRPRDRAGADPAARHPAAPRIAAEEPAGAVALVPAPADPAARHADFRHRRARPDRHGGRAARQGVQFPRRVLRPVSAERASSWRSASSGPRPSKTCCARPTRCRSMRR